MPIHSYEITDTYLELRGVGPGGVIHIEFASIPGNGWNQNRLTKLTEAAQNLIDVRTPLNDPSLVDDPDALVDPARPDFFHDSGDLVSRPVTISNLAFTDGKITFTLSRTPGS